MFRALNLSTSHFAIAFHEHLFETLNKLLRLLRCNVTWNLIKSQLLASPQASIESRWSWMPSARSNRHSAYDHNRNLHCDQPHWKPISLLAACRTVSFVRASHSLPRTVLLFENGKNRNICPNRSIFVWFVEMRLKWNFRWRCACWYVRWIRWIRWNRYGASFSNWVNILPMVNIGNCPITVCESQPTVERQTSIEYQMLSRPNSIDKLWWIAWRQYCCRKLIGFLSLILWSTWKIIDDFGVVWKSLLAFRRFRAGFTLKGSSTEETTTFH